MSMISDATKILVVTTQFSLARIPGRLWRLFHEAYNPWVEPSRKLPRSGEAVECKFQRGDAVTFIAWCFPKLSLNAQQSPAMIATWYVTGARGEQKLDTRPLLWRRVPHRRRPGRKVRIAD